MSNISNEQSAEAFFGEVISTYTRAQGIEDGVLIDAGSMASEAGFNWPVALTSAVWEHQVHQDQSGRLWDVLYMASHAIRTAKESGDRLLFQLYRVARDGHSTEAVLVTLKLIVGPGDAGEPVITILQPHED